MEIAFDTLSLRILCENEEKAKIKFGPHIAQNLKKRLADLRAATNIYDVVAGNPQTFGKNKSQMQIELSNGFQIILSANHPVNPMNDGSVDWHNVSRIKVVRINNDRKK